MKKEHHVNLSCSFCGKSQREVRKLVAGPAVYICDECIGLCNDIIAEEIDRAAATEEENALSKIAPEPPKPPLPKIELWPLPKVSLRLVEFVRSDGIPVLINPRYVAGAVGVPTGNDNGPLTRVSMTGIEGVVEVEGALNEVREKLTKS